MKKEQRIVKSSNYRNVNKEVQKLMYKNQENVCIKELWTHA